MSIDSEMVRRIARLARLRIDDETAARVGGELQSILEYVAKLEELDVTDVPATTHPHGRPQPSRADTPRASLSPEEALGNAPDAAEDHFRVPRVIG